jgi:hypothetical protein
MAQHVTTKQWCIYANRFGVFDDDVANGGSAAQRFERHIRSQKNMPGARVARSPSAEITGQALATGGNSGSVNATPVLGRTSLSVAALQSISSIASLIASPAPQPWTLISSKSA